VMPVLVEVEVIVVATLAVDQMVKSNFSRLSLLVPSLFTFELMLESSSSPVPAGNKWSDKATGSDLLLGRDLLLLPEQAVADDAVKQDV